MSRMSLAYTVALRDFASSSFTRKNHIEEISTWGGTGDSQEFIGNIPYLVCSLPTETIFWSTEIKKASAMIQLCTIQALNIQLYISECS